MSINYEKTLEWLYEQLPMYQRVGKAAYKADMENTLGLDEYFGHPHKKFATIHVAGTNGKGSVSHMLAAVLQMAGYKTGLYTSPHLLDFRERIRINGEMISKKDVADWVEKHTDIFKEVKASFFEMTVAMAFDYFASEEVEIAVIEVGMGGRLDSTNIIVPEVSVITHIAMDHTEFLGKTLLDIAKEKAGIIKDSIPVVIGESRPELVELFAQTAKKLRAHLSKAYDFYDVPYSLSTPDGIQHLLVKSSGETVYPQLRSDLGGLIQRQNIPTVLRTVDVLRDSRWTIPESAVYEGIGRAKELTSLHGRWELLSRNPTLVIDIAHNEDGMLTVVNQLKECRFDQLHVVIGMVNDKAIDDVLRMLPNNARFYFTRSKISRALEPKLLAAKAAFYGLNGNISETVREAIEEARSNAKSDDMILITGSTFVVAEAVALVMQG